MATSPSQASFEMRKLTIPESLANGPDFDLFTKEVESAGVVHSLVIGRVAPSLGPTPGNEDAIELGKRYPQRFSAVVAIDTDDLGPSLEAVSSHLRARAAVALVVEPGLARTPRYLDDSHLNPIWELAEKLKVPALVMGGGVCGPDISYSDPAALDRLAGRCPNVTFVAVHAGHPYIEAMLGCAFRRPNVCVTPDLYLCNVPGADLYVQAANTFLADRMMFGSAYPLVGVEEASNLWWNHPFDEAVRERVFFKNAQRIFGLNSLASS